VQVFRSGLVSGRVCHDLVLLSFVSSFTEALAPVPMRAPGRPDRLLAAHLFRRDDGGDKGSAFGLCALRDSRFAKPRARGGSPQGCSNRRFRQQGFSSGTARLFSGDPVP
ncbi:MAG: hypothetical protein K8F31_12660, partial [Roseovarius sp.]|nr:hypothetical protein [Roseovarius sp.]